MNNGKSDNGDNSQSHPAAAWVDLARRWTDFNWFMKPSPDGEGVSEVRSEALEQWGEFGREWVEQWAALNPFLKLVPLHPLEMSRALSRVATELAQHPQRAQTEWVELWGKQMEVMLQSSRQAMGLEHEAVIEPDRRDRRFRDDSWSTNPVYNALKQSYLLNYEWLLRQVEGNEDLAPEARRRIAFYLRQFMDSLSPSNFPPLNPEVVRETVKSGGENLLRGTQSLMEDLSEGRIKMVEGSGFEFGVNIAGSEGQVVLRTRILELIQYSPSTKTVHAKPILFVPPWINKFYILDLQPKNSMVKYLVDQGFTVYMISWKNPDESFAEFTMEDYITEGLLPAVDAAREITGSDDVHAIGYCIGGTLLAITMAALRAKGDTRINSATFFVSLQDFEEPGDLGVFVDDESLRRLNRRMEKRGYLHADEMSAAMNLLRSNDLIWNYVVNNYFLGKQPMAFDLLYWNADGTNMPHRMHTFYLRNMYLENNLVKPGKLNFLGEPIDLSEIDQDIYAVGTLEDHIVPWKSAFRIRRYVEGSVRFVLASSGHIAGVISPPSSGKNSYYVSDSGTTNPDEWLEEAELKQGSWWEDWMRWLKKRAGKRVAPPPLGTDKHPALEAAPGRYVREGGGDATYPTADVALGVEEQPTTYERT